MLQFAELNEVFPTWTRNSGSTSSSYCPVRELEHIIIPEIYSQGKIVLTGWLKECKFRIIDGKLYVDDRRIQWIRRKMSGDSRWKILEILRKLVEQYRIHSDILSIVKVMYEGAYKNDTKWKEALYSIIPKRYLEITHCVSPMSSGERLVSSITQQEIPNILYKHSRIMLGRKFPGNDTEEQNPPAYKEESLLDATVEHLK